MTTTQDGLASDGILVTAARLPEAVRSVIPPLLVYALVGRGTAGVSPSAPMDSGWLQLQLYPSLWIMLLCVAIAAGTHAMARGQSRLEVNRIHRGARIAHWIVVGLAVFGGFAYMTAWSSLGPTEMVLFPFMGTVTPVR